MRCTKCGTELKEDARFCKACGKEVERADPQTADHSSRHTEQLFQEIRTCLSQLEIDCKKNLETDPQILEENRRLKKQLLEKHDLLEEQEKELTQMKKNLIQLQDVISAQAHEIENLKEELERFKHKTYEGTEKEAAKQQSMTCPNCHAPVDKETIFCGECGRKIQ